MNDHAIDVTILCACLYDAIVQSAAALEQKYTATAEVLLSDALTVAKETFGYVRKGAEDFLWPPALPSLTGELSELRESYPEEFSREYSLPRYYLRLFNAMTDVLASLDAQNYGTAREQLLAAQTEAEDLYAHGLS